MVATVAKLSGPAGLPVADDLGCAGHVQELDVRAMTAQLVAVLALQSRAAHHAAVAAVLGKPLPDRLEPGIAVVVVERLTGRHLGDVGGWMKVVGVRERHPQALRQSRTDGRFTGARNAHDDDW
jgi:hypothetical protein